MSINSRPDAFIGSRETDSDQNRALAGKELMFKRGIHVNNSYVICQVVTSAQKGVGGKQG